MGDIWTLGAGPVVLLGAAVFIGTLFQRLTGQGFGMIAAPALAFIAPEYLPATLLILGFFVGFSSAAVDRASLSVGELPAGLAGRAIGAVVAAWLAVRVAGTEALPVIVACTIYLGIGLSLVGARVPIVPPTLFLAGLTAGIMGTLTAVGAPPMALLYQHEPRRRAAAMQNAFFMWGMIVSLGALATVGLVGPRHGVMAIVLSPGALLALLISGPLARRVDKTSLRPWALGLAGLAATLLIVGPR